MKADEAILLSTLYKSFVTEVYTEAKNYTSLDPISGSRIPQKRWVLSQLYHHVLHVTCRHFCYGVILYHKHCDLVNAISVELGRNKVERLLAQMLPHKNWVQSVCIQAGYSPGLAPVCNCRYDGLFWALNCHSLTKLGPS